MQVAGWYKQFFLANVKVVIYFFFTWESVKTMTVVMDAALHRDSLQRLCKEIFLAGPRAKKVTSVFSRGFVVLRNYKRKKKEKLFPICLCFSSRG